MANAPRIPLEESFPALTATPSVRPCAGWWRRSTPLRIIVFGSYAREETRPGSDLDLLVVLPEVEDKREAAIAMRRVLSGLYVPFDVVVTTPEEIERRGWIIGTVLREALKDRRTVYDQTGTA